MDAWSPLVNRLRELGNPRFSEESLFEKMRQRMMEKDIRHQSVSGLRTHMYTRFHPHIDTHVYHIKSE